MKITIELTRLPLFLDGGDGSMWRARLTPEEQWAELFADHKMTMATRRFVSVADLLTMADKPGEILFDSVDGKFGDPTN